MLKYYTLLLSLIILSQKLIAQNITNIDSLLAVHQNQPEDSMKLVNMNHIINYYMYRDAAKAKKYAYKTAKLSKKLNNSRGIALANYQLGVVYNNLDMTDSARYFYHLSLDGAKVIENNVYISQAYRGLAILEFSQGNLEVADSINNLDLAHTIAQNDSMGMALSYDFKGTINQNRGYIQMALTNVLKGLELFRLLKDEIRIADCLNHLATLEGNLLNYEKAINYNREALKIYEANDDVYYQAQALNDIGIHYLRLNNADSAFSFLEKSIESAERAKTKSIEATALSNIGTAYIKQKDFEKGIDLLKQSLKISEAIKAKRKTALTQIKLAEAYNEINNPQLSISYVQKAIQYSEESGNNSLLYKALKARSTAYERMNNWELALNDWKVHKNLGDTLLNKEKIKQIEELRIIYDTERKEAALALQEKEIETLNQKAKADQLRKTLYAGGTIAGILVSLLLYVSFKQRLKQTQLEREKQEEIYKQEIEFKKKELASQTLHLVQKNTFLQELKDNLEKIGKSPDKFKIEFRRIVMLLKRESTTNKDWEVFKSYFSEVHNNFDNKIKAIYPNITEKELRLASFIKMNLSTKEIAVMNNVLPESVKKSKYRLKKKLQLDRETDIYRFLIEL